MKRFDWRMILLKNYRDGIICTHKSIFNTFDKCAEITGLR